jgi:hypothetical protein
MNQSFSNHEEGIIKSFIIPSKISRYLSLIESPKGRAKFLNGLDHFDDLDSRHIKKISSSQQTAEAIEKLLKSKGAPSSCHVISSNREIDNLDLPLNEALCKVIGLGMGAFISCIPGKLAYFEAEDENERYLLERS